MLYFTSSVTASPERIVINREEGRETDEPYRGYRYPNEDVEFHEAARRLSTEGSVIYAIRLADNTIKIGWTADLPGRWRYLKCR